MRELLLTSLLIFALFDPTIGQLPTDLVLSGRISDTYRENFKDYVIWKARLMLEFTDRGPRPVILLNPGLSIGIGKKELIFYFKRPFLDTAAKESIGLSYKSRPESDPADALSKLAKQLDQDSPPENLVVILKPGESLPFSDEVVVKQMYFHHVDGPIFNDGNKWDGTMDDASCLKYIGRRETGCPLNFASKLTVRYEVDFSNFKGNPTLLSQLNSRWRDYGQIQLSGESSISLTSQPISIYPIEWITLVDPEHLALGSACRIRSQPSG